MNRAAELKYGNLMVLQQQLSRAETSLAARHGSGSSMLREEVTAADISEVISKWTGIPVQVHAHSHSPSPLYASAARASGSPFGSHACASSKKAC